MVVGDTASMMDELVGIFTDGGFWTSLGQIQC